MEGGLAQPSWLAGKKAAAFEMAAHGGALLSPKCRQAWGGRWHQFKACGRQQRVSVTKMAAGRAKKQNKGTGTRDIRRAGHALASGSIYS